MAVGNGAHNRANGKAVEIVVDKDKYAEQEGGKHSSCAGFNVTFGPVTKCTRTACLINKGNYCAQNNKENKNTRGVGNGGNNAVAYNHVNRAGKGKVGADKGAGNNTDEKGGINLFGYKGKADSDNRRNKSPKGGVHFA